jgi:hypothetical protein
MISEFAYSIADPLTQFGIASVKALPGIVVAIIILLVGWLVAWILGFVIKNVLLKVGLDTGMKKAGIGNALGKLSLSKLLGLIVKWFVFLVFLGEAVSQLQLGSLSLFLDSLVMWLPNLVVASLIVVCGLIVSDYVTSRIKAAKTKRGDLFASGVYYVIMILVVLIALNQIGIDISLLTDIIKLFFGALFLGLAIALGIGFGGAIKGNAAKWLKRFK